MKARIGTSVKRYVAREKKRLFEAGKPGKRYQQKMSGLVELEKRLKTKTH